MADGGNLSRVSSMTSPPMRDLIRAFSTAAKDRLVRLGWHKRSGDIFTLELHDAYSAWLGLNRASKHRPLNVNPVVGVRHDGAMRLQEELANLERSVTPTLSEPLVGLARSAGVGQLTVETIEGADNAADRLVELLDAYGLPFVRELAADEAMLAALRERRHLPVREYALSRLPAALTALNRIDEARAAASATINEVAERTDAAAEQYRLFARELLSYLDTLAADG